MRDRGDQRLRHPVVPAAAPVSPFRRTAQVERLQVVQEAQDLESALPKLAAAEPQVLQVSQRKQFLDAVIGNVTARNIERLQPE